MRPNGDPCIIHKGAHMSGQRASCIQKSQSDGVIRCCTHPILPWQRTWLHQFKPSQNGWDIILTSRAIFEHVISTASAGGSSPRPHKWAVAVSWSIDCPTQNSTGESFRPSMTPTFERNHRDRAVAFTTLNRVEESKSSATHHNLGSDMLSASLRSIDALHWVSKASFRSQKHIPNGSCLAARRAATQRSAATTMRHWDLPSWNEPVCSQRFGSSWQISSSWSRPCAELRPITL